MPNKQTQTAKEEEIAFLKSERGRLLTKREKIGNQRNVNDSDLSSMVQIGNRLTAIYWMLHHKENAA